jgi:tRNA threonylcarbamoyladenosine biosynthesis protein TsaE
MHEAPIVKSMCWPHEAATRACADALAACPALRDGFIALQGELGAGKTTFVRLLLQALGVQGRIKSPTYAVVEPYSVVDPLAPAEALSIWHFDFYRFDDPREWEDAGFRDIFASPGLKLAEWPDKAAGMLPVPDLVLQIAVGDDDVRQVQATARSPRGLRLLEACAG